MAISRADVLVAVERSPAAFGVHDRDAWIDAFTFDGRVEDPVGSHPHRGRTAIASFYDTFIGPRDITFHRDVDIVVGATVIRDLELEVGMGAGLTMRIPAYLRYDVADHQGELKIAALYAFWELPAMVAQFLRGGLKSVPPGLRLSKGLLLNQGLIGTLGFLSGFRGPGPQGKRRFGEFLADARAGDEVAVRRWLGKGTRITRGDDEPMGSAELLSRLAGAQQRKVIAAGYSLAVGVDCDGRRDVLMAEVATGSFAINRIRYFSDAV
ncbi:nuclear transport factor 2 family protein [Mycolicibacterium holsaticum]|uniref:nuclear transport factor 2 family protein n=1 Tax=Mycolicibacterium holsaticum TaxID=152142 RepID=UPI001C7CFED4|nr:nuclear transport factor 2 family protein [Mycolicibacterium holsaticum]MDA4107612.1 nuclear transport factor 2 [Mycolicibacterium holsaticum DSM 44478 = JCM 12374]QZA14926.1 nuclear transport factor 2 family protein [Mycolicibacterium holsaticum DSM 44478 = JCM 12374]UNC07636.1 nuclear transport factor 2 family protein [Mycolicibacterium holsaticum DSM 44478 = JCM 12374]